MGVFLLFQQGEFVEIALQNHPLSGKIVRVCGVATNPQMVVGATVIVDLGEHQKLVADTYPFSHCVMFECHLKKVVV